MTRRLFALALAACALGAALAADPALADEAETYTVRIPKQYRGGGYSLRIDGLLKPLTGSQVEVTGHDYRERIELVDAYGRLESSSKKTVDMYVFDHVRTRSWRISTFFGSTQINGSKTSRLLQNGQASEADVDLDWQPTAFGLRLGAAELANDLPHDVGGQVIDSSYTDSQVRLAATWEAAPLAGAGGIWCRLHTLAFLGGFVSHNDVRVGDDAVSIDSQANADGALAGVDLNLALTAWFWLGIRGYASYQHATFKEFGDSQDLVAHGALVGGSYAF